MSSVHFFILSQCNFPCLGLCCQWSKGRVTLPNRMKRFLTAVDPHPLPLRMVPISGNHVPCLHFILSGPCTTLHIFDRYKVPTWAWAVWAPFWYYIEMCRHSFHRFTPHIVNLRFFKKSYKKLHTKCSKQRRVGGTFFLIMLKNCRISSQ